MPPQKFKILPEVPHDTRESLAGYDDLSQTLLHARGITTKEAAEDFFSLTYDGKLHDPFLLPDMEQAVERILRAIEQEETIIIYSDYDCDGIPGGTLMHDFFSAIKYEHFENYIPHRHDEGYGLNIDALERLRASGASLIITVDCGITDVAQAKRASELGLDLIITDHHEPGEILPPALAVVNPKRADNRYPFRELCGSGVAFKLVSALIARGSFDLPAGREKWWLDVVGLATIADMVPLRDENRLFAHYGLLVMRKNRRLGLQHLFRTMRMQARDVTEDDIGFMIAPRINAASRMGLPRDAFALLATTDEAEAGSYARLLDRTNNERKGVVGAMVKEIKHRIERRETLSDVLVIGDPAWRPALVGLAANTLVEEYARPVFIWGRDGRGLLKGSCRSDGSVSVVTLMRNVQDAFIEYGGHHASGGFSVREESIHDLAEHLSHAYRELTGERSISGDIPLTSIDAQLTLADIERAHTTLKMFAPFGEGNPKPLFVFRNISPTRVERFGKTKEHLRARFPTERGEVEAIMFFAPHVVEDVFYTTPSVDLVAHIEESAFGGKRTRRLRMVEVLPPGSPRIAESV